MIIYKPPTNSTAPTPIKYVSLNCKEQIKNNSLNFGYALMIHNFLDDSDYGLKEPKRKYND